MSCPRCGSGHRQSNKINQGTLDSVAHAGQAARSVGYPAVAFGAVMIWGGMQTLNALRNEWECLSCGHTYS